MSWTRRVPLNLNVGIAKAHQFAGQLIGIQLAVANILAQAVSMTSIVAGATMLAVQQFPSAWPLWIAAAGIGVGLALLIEGVTLGALIRVRVAGRAIRTAEQVMEKQRDKQMRMLTVPDPTSPQYALLLKRFRQTRQLIERECRRTCKQAVRLARRDRRNSLLLALGGCVASMCGGSLFYHSILTGFGQLVSMALSAVFTLAVTGTFISSELFKDLQEQAIRENFVNGNLAESAMRQETRMRSLWAVHQRIGTYLQSPEAQKVIDEGGNLLVTSILATLQRDLRQSLVSETIPVGETVVEELEHDSETPAAHLTPALEKPQGMRAEQGGSAQCPSEIPFPEQPVQKSSEHGSPEHPLPEISQHHHSRSEHGSGEPQETAERHPSVEGDGSEKRRKSVAHAPVRAAGTKRPPAPSRTNHQKGQRDPIQTVQKGESTALPYHDRVKAVMMQAAQTGVPLTNRQIAQAAGVSHATVRRYAPRIRLDLYASEIQKEEASDGLQ